MDKETMVNDLFNSPMDFLCMLDLLGVTDVVVILRRKWLFETPNRCTCTTKNQFIQDTWRTGRRDRLTPQRHEYDTNLF